MALSTYSELEDAVGRWLDRTDRTVEIQEWVRLTELEVGRKLGLRSQQSSTTGTLTGGTNIVQTPAGILTPKLLVFESSPPVVVDVVTLAQGELAQFDESGAATPTKATVWGLTADFKTQILVWPTPSGNVNYTLYYETGITALTAAAPTNYLLLMAADLYLYGCLFQAAMFDKDTDGAASWRPLLDEQIKQVKKIEALARVKAGLLRARPPARYLTA